MTLRHKALLGLLLAATIWGTAGTSAKFLIRETHPFVITFYRFLVATLILFPLFLRAKKRRGWFADMLPLGIFNAGNVLFYYSALAYTTANTGSLLGAAIPVLTALLARFTIGEPIPRNKVLGIILGLFGALIIILVPILEKGQAVGTSLLGNLLMVGSTFSWTFYIVRSRAASAKESFDPLVATFVNFATCTVAALLFVLATGKSFAAPAFADPGYVALFAYVVLGISVTTFFVFQWSVQHLSATTAALKDYYQLIVAVAVNTVFLGEVFTPLFFVGSLLIVSGMAIAAGQRFGKKLLSFLLQSGS